MQNEIYNVDCNEGSVSHNLLLTNFKFEMLVVFIFMGMEMKS